MQRYLSRVRLENESYLNNLTVLWKVLGIQFSISKDIVQLPLSVEVELVSRLGLKSEDPRLLINSDKSTDEIIEACNKRDVFIVIKTI